MGMYTELYVNARIAEDIAKEDLEILRALFDKDFPNRREFLENTKLPIMGEHVACIGIGCSYYFMPYAYSHMWYDDIAKQWYILSRSDFKNYNREIEQFFDWFQYLVDIEDATKPVLIGYHRYEENNEPTLVYAQPDVVTCEHCAGVGVIPKSCMSEETDKEAD